MRQIWRRARAVAASFALSLLLISLAAPGCDRSPERSEQAERLSFTITDSLLGAELAVPQANKVLRVPAGFEALSDALLDSLRGLRAEIGGSGTSVELVAALVDPARGGGLTASVIPGVSLGDDQHIERYESVLREVASESDVRSGAYMVNDVLVRNNLVSDSTQVRFHLLCLSEGDAALELVYFAPRLSYPTMVRAFESSIGTIRVLRKGG